MTAYNFTDGSIAGQPVMTQQTLIEDKLVIIRNILDFDNQTVASASTAQALILPADCTVLSAWIRVIDAGATNTTCDLGITGVDVETWGAALALDSAAGTILGALFDTYHTATADTLDLLVTTDTADVSLTQLKCEVCALVTKQIDKY